MPNVHPEDIVDAAIELFSQNGYHATSMRDIAKAVNIRKPSLYHHFDSKEDILLTILKVGMDQLLEELEIIVASDETSITKLRAAIAAHASMIGDNPAGAAVFLREDRGLGDEYLSQYVAKRDRFEAYFREIVTEGVNVGVFRPTDVAISVNALLGMVNWMTRWYRPDGRLSAAEIADHFADLFLEGLLTKEANIEETS